MKLTREDLIKDARANLSRAQKIEELAEQLQAILNEQAGHLPIGGAVKETNNRAKSIAFALLEKCKAFREDLHYQEEELKDPDNRIG